MTLCLNRVTDFEMAKNKYDIPYRNFSKKKEEDKNTILYKEKL